MILAQLEETEWISNVIEFWKKIDKGDLVTGVIVPIIAAVLAYYLAEGASRRKENNRLVIELYWIRKEIERNKQQFDKYITSIGKRREVREVLKYPFVPYDDLIVNIMEKIEKIHQEHPIFNDFFLCGEHSIEMVKLSQKYELTEKNILELEEDFESYPEMPEQKKKELGELRIEQNELKRKIEDRIGNDDSIFAKLHSLHYYIEKQKIGSDIPSIEEENEVAKCLNYFRTVLKEYTEINLPTLDDALTALKKLIVYSSRIEVFEDVSDLDELQMETRKIHLNKCSTQEAKIINMFQNYISLKKLNNEIDNFEFDIVDSKWGKFQDDLVLINNRNIYFKISNLYDKMVNISKNEIAVSSITNNIVEVLSLIESLETKLKRKC